MDDQTMLKVLLVLLMCSGCIVEAESNLFSYKKIDKLDTQPPVYVEELNSLKVYRKTWKIVGRINIGTYDEEFKQMQQMVNELSGLCTSLNGGVVIDTWFKLSSKCEKNVMELQRIINNMEINWTQFMMPTIERGSRGNIIDVDGYVAKFDEINKKQGLLSNVIDDKHYATFIDSSRYFFKKMTNEEKYLKENIDEIMKIFNQAVTDKELKGARLKHLFHDIYLYMNVLVFDFQFRQKSFYDAVISGTVLPTDSLQDSLKELRNVIKKKNFELPFSLDGEFNSTFYKVTTAESMIIKKQLVFAYTLPIVERQSFTLYHLTAYPSKLQGQLFQLMLPDHEYVAINENKKNYIIMNEKDLQQCYHTNSLLCKLTTAIISTEKTESCAIDLLVKPEVSSHCNYRMMNLSNELWLPLKNENSWLVVFPKPQQVTIECNDFVDISYIVGEGILTMKPMCSAKTELVEIVASDTPTDKNYKQIILKTEMRINWKTIVDRMSGTNITSFLIPKVINKKQLDILEQISIDVNHVKLLQEESQLHDKLEKIGERINIGIKQESQLQEKLEKMDERINIFMNNSTVLEKDLFEVEEIEIVNYIVMAIVLLNVIYKIIYYLKGMCASLNNNDLEGKEFV